MFQQEHLYPYIIIDIINYLNKCQRDTLGLIGIMKATAKSGGFPNNEVEPERIFYLRLS